MPDRQSADAGSVDYAELARVFDCGWYLAAYPDVAAAGVNPLEHYLRHGAAEGRDPGPLFSTNWYLQTYPDIAAAGVNPLEHYLRHGAAEGRDPGPLFSTNWYSLRYPDVVASGLNPLAHYLACGAAQGRLPRPPLSRLGNGGPTLECWSEVRGVLRDFADLEIDLAAIPLESLARLPITKFLPNSCTLAWRKLYLSLDRAPRRLVLMGSIDDERQGRSLKRMLQAAHEVDDAASTLVLDIDATLSPTGEQLPRNTAWRSLAEFGTGLSQEDRVTIGTALINWLQPDAVLIWGSRTGWDIIARHGAALGRKTEIFATSDSSPDSEPSKGNTNDLMHRYFRGCLPSLSALYSDDDEWLAQMADRHGLPVTERSKLRALPPLAGQPAAASVDASRAWRLYVRAWAASPGFLGVHRRPKDRNRDD
ncbi:MAG: hypothetical protein WB646_09750 [Steroidobacteraceae bacterium]